MATKQRQNSKLGILYPSLLFVVFVGTSVEEHILLARMPVHITVKNHSPLPVFVSDELLRVVDSWVQKFVRREPLSV